MIVVLLQLAGAAALILWAVRQIRNGVERSESDRRRAVTRREELTGRIEQLEADLAEARKREEAVNLTLVTATRTKEELMGDAQEAVAEAEEAAKKQAEKIISDAQYEAFRLVTQANTDAEQAGSRGGSRPQYEDWTREELYDRARELGIEGRSKMGKGELIEALRRGS